MFNLIMELTMLTPRQIELIKATVPVLREHGVALTSHFYKRMLEGNPELRNVFNSAHQARGHQQKALASAVLAYAENIENPSVLIEAVKHIASKHCSMGIRAEQYGIVGRHLLASIKEVLGDAASEELIEAWAAAYQDLAALLTGIESDIYEKQTLAQGGWSGWRPFTVVEKIPEAVNVTSFVLKPADGGKVPAYQSGQFISVRVFVPSLGVMQPRQYSLSHASLTDGTLRITVKRIVAQDDKPSGLVSNHLHDSLKVGDLIELSAPAGEFYLKEGTNPVALVSAGIGITPIFAMLEDIAVRTPGRPVSFMHVVQSPDCFALRKEVKEQLDKLTNLNYAVYFTKEPPAHVCPCARKGRPGKDDLKEFTQEGCDVYICGPSGFMSDMIASAKAAGVSSDRIHFEAFGTGHQS